MIDNRRYITIEFGPGFSRDERGPILLAMERAARNVSGQYDEIFLERLGDDSKLRSSMTVEERSKL